MKMEQSAGLIPALHFSCEERDVKEYCDVELRNGVDPAFDTVMRLVCGYDSDGLDQYYVKPSMVDDDGAIVSDFIHLNKADAQFLARFRGDWCCGLRTREDKESFFKASCGLFLSLHKMKHGMKINGNKQDWIYSVVVVLVDVTLKVNDVVVTAQSVAIGRGVLNI